MEDFLKTVSSPAWWGGVVIAGLMINITSAYLKNWLDGYFNQRSERAKKKSERYKQLRAKQIERVLREHDGIVVLHIEQLYWTLVSVATLLASLIIILLNNSSLNQYLELILTLMSYMLMAIALFAIKNGHERDKLIHEAISLRRQREKEQDVAKQ